MKKLKNILLSVLAVLAVVVLPPNVNAEEITTDYVDNITVVKSDDNNKYAVKFTLKKGVSLLEGKNSYIGVSWYYEKDGMENHFHYPNVKIIDENTTFDTTEPDGLTSSYGKDLSIGTILAVYMDVTKTSAANEDFNTLPLKFQIVIQAENYDYEYVDYDVKNNTILKVKKGHNYESEAMDKIGQKYQLGGYGNDSEEEVKDLHFIILKDVSENEYLEQNIVINNYKDKTIEEIYAEIDEQLKTASYEMRIDEDNQTIGSNILETIKTSQKKANISETIYDAVANKFVTLYTWTLDGSKVTDTNLNLNLKVNLGTSKSKETIDTLVPDKEKSMVIEFLHHGVLPTGTTVKVNVLSKYNNGDLVTLYYYNEETKALEMVSKNLEVKDGFVELALEHCSEYVLAYQPELIVDNVAKEEEKTNNAQTSSMNVTKYASIGVISLIAGIYLVVSKKITA